MILRRISVLAIAPAIVAGAMAAPAAAQSQPPQPPASATAQPTVDVKPVDTKPDDPNGGQWFVATATPGQTIRMRARFVNPAEVPQTVKVYLADLEFSDEGTAQIGRTNEFVSTWGGFDAPEITVPARSSIEAPFSFKVPEGAEPGDHIGAVVAESAAAPVQGNALLKIKQRTATRLYITVPGDARPDITIESVTLNKDSGFLTKEATLEVTVRNTGRVRLRPTVTVNGTQAEGPALLMSQSVEKFIVTKKVPMWGGPQRYRVDVRTTRDLQRDAGPSRQARVSMFVIPWLLFIFLAVAAGLFMLARRMWRRRGSKYAEMKADMKRIERLLSEQRSAGNGAGNGRAETPEQAIKAAMKRAARAGDADAEERLRHKLEEHQQDIKEQHQEVKAAAAPVTSPEPVTLAPEPAPAAQTPALDVTIVGEASVTAIRGNGNGNSAAEADSVAVTLIRSALERAQARGDAAEVARLQAKLDRERAHT
jgi:hypothetical protein